MSGMISLLAGGEQTDRDLLRPGSPLGAAAAPDLARHHRRAHRLLGTPVRGLQPRAAKKREGRLPFPMEMVRESFVGRRVGAPSQRPVQPCFHLPASHRQARLADIALAGYDPKSRTVSFCIQLPLDHLAPGRYALEAVSMVAGTHFAVFSRTFLALESPQPAGAQTTPPGGAAAPGL